MGKYKTSTSALHMYGMVTHKIYNTLTYSLTHSLRYVLRKNDENFHANWIEYIFFFFHNNCYNGKKGKLHENLCGGCGW